MASTQNNPKTLGTYQTTPLASYAIGATLQFTIVPGSGASQGAGELIIGF